MKRNTLERREKIKDLILSEGLWSLNKKQLSRNFKVSYPTIYNDIRGILKKIPDDKIEEIGVELNFSFKEALTTARKLTKCSDVSLKLKAIDVLTKVIDRYTGFLEAFGKKPITPELLDINKKEFRIEYLISGNQNAIVEFRDYVYRRSINENRSPFFVLADILGFDINPDYDTLRAWLNCEMDFDIKTDFQEFQEWCKLEKKAEGICLLKEFETYQKWELYKKTVGRFHKTKDGEFDKKHFKLYLENFDNLSDPEIHDKIMKGSNV